MKKLLVMMVGLATSVFAFGDPVDLPTGTSFEQLNAGDKLDLNVGDDGQAGGNLFWSSEDTELDATVTEYDGDAYTGDRPAQFAEAAQANYLTLQTGTKTPLLRTVEPCNGGIVPRDIGEGLYVDTLVKFTGCESAPEPGAEDKLIVWVKAPEDEDVDQTTNLVITAAYLDQFGDPVATNYIATVNGLDDFNAWHRVTVKAIADISADNLKVPGFVVFVDGQVATCADAKGHGDSAFGNLTTLAGKWNAQNALFPSMLVGAVAYQTLKAVGFEGSGAIDDVSFTDVAPDFAEDSIAFNLSWTAKDVDAISYTLNSEEAVVLTPAQLEAGEINIPVAAGAQSTVAVLVDYADGMKKGVWTANGGATVDDTVFTIAADATAPAGVIVAAVAANIGSISIDGSDAVSFGTLAEAFGLAKTATASCLITLTKGATLNAADNMLLCEASLSGAVVTLDLNGQTIEGVSGEVELDYAIDVECALVIKDSTGGGKIVAGEGQAGALFNALSLTIEDDDIAIDGRIDVYEEGGQEVAETVLKGGKFIKEGGNTKEQLENWLDTSADPELYVDDTDEDYFEVKEQTEPPADYVAQVGEDKFESIAEAITAADADGTVTILKNCDVEELLVVENPITIDLAGWTLTAKSADGFIQFTTTANGFTVKNGTIASGLTEASEADMISAVDAAGTFKDLTVYSTYYETGVSATTDGGEEAMKAPYAGGTLVCTNVTVAGPKRLFYTDNVSMELIDCAATQSGEATPDWANCAISAAWGATVTVKSGVYEGKYVLNMMSSVAKIVVEGGKFTGTVKDWPLAPASREAYGTHTWIIKGGDFNDTNIPVEYIEQREGYIASWVDSEIDGYKTPAWTKQDFGGGSGAENDPYIIATADHLVELQTKVAAGDTFAGKFFEQTAEITVTEWTGIGTVDSKAFSGVYNGNGQTLNVSYAGKSNYGGFFNYLTNGAVISNLTFVASLGAEPNDGEFGFAAVAGRAVASTIADITVNGTIGTAAKPLSHNAAGVVVRADGGTTIKDCVNNASVFGAYTKMGGFVAIVNGGGTVTFENCVNNGAITAKTIDNGKTAGADGLSGILGYTQSNAAIVLNNCENKGTLTGIEGSTIGTIVGKVQNGSVTATGCKAQADVASFGTIVTAGTPVTGLSFATVDAGVATFVADDALAADNTYKVMAAGAAPVFAFTAIDQTITFKTNLFDDVDFAGITLDKTIEETAKITHTEDAEGVTFKAEEVGMPDPIPPVNPGASADDVNNAVDQAGFEDASVKAMIGGNATKYIEFKTWAGTIDGGETAVVNSLHAADSFQLGLTALLENDPVSEIKTVAKDGDTFTFTFEIKDGADGAAVAAAANDYVKSLVKCAEDVGFATTIDADVTVDVVGTTLTAEVALPTGKAAAFMKVAK